MATTKLWAVHTRLDHLVRYAANTEKTANLTFDDLAQVLEYAGEDYKTEQKFFVSGINCAPETAYPSMRTSLQLSTKEIRVLGYHGYQSFLKGEVNAHTAHEIGVKLAEELWGERFQVLVATHCNTDHFHNHFVLCSTSFRDGSRYHSCTANIRKMREASDRLCREYGLHVIDAPWKGRSKHYAEWEAERQGNPTWRGLIKADVDQAIAQAVTDKQFFYLLQKQGYQIKIGKDISVRPQGKERFVRLARNFGEEYSREKLFQRILANDNPHGQEYSLPRSTGTALVRGQPWRAKRSSGLRALYLHYCYRLGILPKQKHPSPAKMAFVLREDLLKLNQITEETRLLVRCHIDTEEQLFSFRDARKAQIGALSERRKGLRNEVRHVGVTEAGKKAMRSEIASLSAEIEQLRKEEKLCDGIAERSGLMKEKLKTLRREETSYESGRGCNRPIHARGDRGN